MLTSAAEAIGECGAERARQSEGRTGMTDSAVSVSLRYMRKRRQFSHLNRLLIVRHRSVIRHLKALLACHPSSDDGMNGGKGDEWGNASQRNKEFSGCSRLSL